MKVASISGLALVATATMTGVARAEMFNGPSVGVQAGWQENKLRNPRTNLGVAAIDSSKDSAILGGFVGYDKRLGKLVFGGEAGLNFGTSDTMSSATGVNRISIDPKRSFDLTARAGYLVNATTLVYGRAGYTNDRIHTTLTSASGTASASEDRDGWLVGAGVEHALTDKVSARLEYRYADLSNGHGKYDRNQVMTGVVFHF